MRMSFKLKETLFRQYQLSLSSIKLILKKQESTFNGDKIKTNILKLNMINIF